MNFPILSTLIFLPLVSSLFILLSKEQKKSYSSIYISLFGSIATFLLSLFLWYSLDLNTAEFQFVEENSWINNFIKFKLGIDGISKLIKIISNKAGRLQTGFIYDYAFVMLIGLSIFLTYLILN